MGMINGKNAETYFFTASFLILVEAVVISTKSAAGNYTSNNWRPASKSARSSISS
jgi:hypothetical protein